MEVFVIDREDFIDAPIRKKLIFLVEKILSYFGLPDGTELCLSLVNDSVMRELNKSYRRIDRTTDVLCFPQKNELNPNLLGDIVISYPTALRHSKTFGIGVDEELRMLIIHGVLHLLGFDHKKRKEREVMRKKEREVLDYVTGI